MRPAIFLVLAVGLAACESPEVSPENEEPEDANVALVDESEDPPQLTEEDWTVAGVFPGADSALVRQVLGEPNEINSSEHPYDAFGELIAWEYDGLTVHFNQPANASAVTIRGRAYETRRGITVGDPLAKVEEAYGAPDDTEWSRWLYCDPQYEECVTLIQFRNSDGHVTEIFLGTPAQ